MNSKRIKYRIQQFQNAIFAILKEEDLELARKVLTPSQMVLFSKLQSYEKAHAIQVLKTLQTQGPTPKELERAALLHDIGKIQHPLRLWERVLIVLGRAVFPERSKDWGKGKPGGLKRPFVVSVKHPAWGAKMVADCGGSPLVVYLIRHHQEPIRNELQSQEGRLLRLLQQADEEN